MATPMCVEEKIRKIKNHEPETSLHSSTSCSVDILYMYTSLLGLNMRIERLYERIAQAQIFRHLLF